MKRRGFLTHTGILALAVMSTKVLGQSSWPARPIKLVLPYAAGGPTDVVARLVAIRLGQRLGQPIVVENRAGAGGIIATESVVQAAPDGYTLLYHSGGLAVASAVYKNLRFDPSRDLATVGMTATIPSVLLVHPSIPADTPQAFFDYLRANPGKLAYGSGGVGNGSHLGVERILHDTGTSAVHVAYKGTAPAMVALVGGQVQFMVDALSSALPHIQDGRVRAIATLSATRAPQLPKLPTLAETVLPGTDQSAWQGILAPAGTPAPIIQNLNANLNAVLADPEVRNQLEQMSVAIRPSSPEEFGSLLAKDMARWAQVAQLANISLD